MPTVKPCALPIYRLKQRHVILRPIQQQITIGRRRQRLQPPRRLRIVRRQLLDPKRTAHAYSQAVCSSDLPPETAARNPAADSAADNDWPPTSTPSAATAIANSAPPVARSEENRTCLQSSRVLFRSTA